MSKKANWTLPSHNCEPIADFTQWMKGDRVAWVGRITDPPDDHPEEDYCLHLKTGEKPLVVFGMNTGDLEFLSVMLKVINDDRGVNEINDSWLESMANSAKAKSSQVYERQLPHFHKEAHPLFLDLVQPTKDSEARLVSLLSDRGKSQIRLRFSKPESSAYLGDKKIKERILGFDIRLEQHDDDHMDILVSLNNTDQEIMASLKQALDQIGIYPKRTAEHDMMDVLEQIDMGNQLSLEELDILFE